MNKLKAQGKHNYIIYFKISWLLNSSFLHILVLYLYLKYVCAIDSISSYKCQTYKQIIEIINKKAKAQKKRIKKRNRAKIIKFLKFK